MIRITERLFIGDVEDKEPPITAVLSVAVDLDMSYPKAIEYAKVGLIDGPGNKHGTILAAVLMTSQLLQRHPSVLLICHGAVSRSPLVAALYMASRFEAGFEAVWDIVKRQQPDANPSLVLLEQGKALIPVLRDLLKQGY